MHVSPLRLVSGCCVFVLALSTGCSVGEDGSASSFGGSFTASQASQVSTASQVTTEDTAGTTGDPATGQAVSVTEASGATTGDPSAGTTGEPATTEPATTEPATTEPATTEPATTGPDPSTTDADPSTTTGMTSMTTMDETTGDPPPPPPPNDPQPANGLYEPCVDNTPCEPALTDGCFTITDAMTMKVIDGYCTILCTSVADCGPAPKAPAVQECFSIAADQKVCGLKCKGVADCPTGMACTNLALPNNRSGMYCT